MQALFEKELRRVMREDESSNPARALRRRFRALSIAFHPDRHADKKCEHLRTFVKAQQALNAANSSLRGEADAVAWERTRCDLKIEEHDSREEEREWACSSYVRSYILVRAAGMKCRRRIGS